MPWNSMSKKLISKFFQGPWSYLKNCTLQCEKFWTALLVILAKPLYAIHVSIDCIVIYRYMYSTPPLYPSISPGSPVCSLFLLSPGRSLVASKTVTALFSFAFSTSPTNLGKKNVNFIFYPLEDSPKYQSKTNGAITTVSCLSSFKLAHYLILSIYCNS